MGIVFTERTNSMVNFHVLNRYCGMAEMCLGRERVFSILVDSPAQAVCKAAPSTCHLRTFERQGQIRNIGRCRKNTGLEI